MTNSFKRLGALAIMPVLTGAAATGNFRNGVVPKNQSAFAMPASADSFA